MDKGKDFLYMFCNMFVVKEVRHKNNVKNKAV